MRTPQHPTIVPTILVKGEREFRDRVRAVAGVAPIVHIDVMDGAFVPRRTWANPKVIAKLRGAVRFAVHLMVREPSPILAAWAKIARVETIIVHAGATKRLPELLADVHLTGKRVGLAVNPETPLYQILPALPYADEVLLMANAPGFSGRPFLPKTLARIATLRSRAPELVIGVDIGVNLETAPQIAAAGATYAAAGSAIFDAEDPARAYRALVRAFQGGRG
ncbi:MAG: ribulose-phosphate 3-epimerase [bacterium]|nr:ribulose-phosphate 3-epimerase [bacterium]